MRPEDTIRKRKGEQKKTKSGSVSRAEGYLRDARGRETDVESRISQGNANPFMVVLYYRQKAILQNQRAIMAELGIDV